MTANHFCQCDGSYSVTVKHKDEEQLTKSRLVARGFEEKDKEKLLTDSPTCCKENLRVLFAIIA